MAILVSDIIARIRTVGLDAQPDTDYYDDLIDLVPAIDSSVKWLMSAINRLRSENKATDEIVRELTNCVIYRTSAQSRITFDSDVWTIDAVQPLPLTVSNGSPTPANPSDFTSLKRTDLVFLSSNYSADRKTIEETGEQSNNPFSPGYLPATIPLANLVEGSDLNVDFSYLAPYNYNNPNSALGTFIEIRPYIPKKLCAVFLTSNPATITGTGDTVLFPQSVFNILYEKALQFVSYSQGDGTNIWTVTEDDLRSLLKAIS